MLFVVYDLAFGTTEQDQPANRPNNLKSSATMTQTRAAEERITRVILTPSKVAFVLAAVAVLLVAASIAGQLAKYLLGHAQIYGLVPLFYVDSEKNIPTLYSVFLLLFAAVLLAVISVFRKKAPDGDFPRWAVLTAGFLYMAIDEGASIHELMISPMQGLLGPGPLGMFYFAWVIPGIGIVLLVALFLIGFLQRLPAGTRFRFIIAATIYFGGAIGIELIGGWYAELHGYQNLTYSMLATVEESLEMAGVIVFIYALLKYIADSEQEVQVRFGDAKDARGR